VVFGPPARADEVRATLGPGFEVVGRADGTDPSPAAVSGDEWARALLEVIADSVCLSRADGTVLWSNAGFQALEETVRALVADLCRKVAPGIAAGSRSPEGESVAAADVWSADGTKVFEVSIKPAGSGSAPSVSGRRAPRGAPDPGANVAIVVRDVTEARRRRHKLEAIDRAGNELTRLDAESVRRMNSVERLKAMEAKIVAVARDLLHFDHFGIRLLDEVSGRLELVVSCGLPASYADLDIYPLRDANGISGFVAATGQSYLCDDITQDPLFLPGLAGARSSLTVPLKLHDRVIGILNVESEQLGAFGEEDRQFAEIFTRYIAMALHILDLLVVERSTVNKAVTGRMEGELSEPLQDILREVDYLLSGVPHDAESATHIARIRADVESIRARVREVGAGPTTLLGIERALADKTVDPVLAGRRVLVADDESKIRRIIGDVLRNRGCEVTICESGSRAIEAINAGAAAGRNFDLIVSDIRMPDRNGYEVYSAVRRTLGDVPVILMTGFGYDPHHSIVRASQDGLHAVLFKPFPVERMVDEVRKALAARGGTGTGPTAGP